LLNSPFPLGFLLFQSPFSLSLALKMEPAVRVELTTGGLRNRCSTTELRWHAIVNLQVLTLSQTYAPQYYMRRSGRGKDKEVLAGGFEPLSEAAVPSFL
jgi:hypothetical protein